MTELFTKLNFVVHHAIDLTAAVQYFNNNLNDNLYHTKINENEK